MPERLQSAVFRVTAQEAVLWTVSDVGEGQGDVWRAFRTRVRTSARSNNRASMERGATTKKAADAFEAVRTVGLAMPGVEAVTRYDGSPALKAGGCFMAGVATHPSAEPETLVV